MARAYRDASSLFENGWMDGCRTTWNEWMDSLNVVGFFLERPPWFWSTTTNCLTSTSASNGNAGSRPGSISPVAKSREELRASRKPLASPPDPSMVSCALLSDAPPSATTWSCALAVVSPLKNSRYLVDDEGKVDLRDHRVLNGKCVYMR